MLRSSVVTPRYRPLSSGLSSSSMSRSSVSSVGSKGYRPRYCAAPSKYFSTTPVLPVAPVVTRSAASSYSSVLGSTGSMRLGGVRAAGTSKYFDPEYPSRQFGSRLSKTHTAVHVRPQLHEEFYGSSSLPVYGRDSWSAYKMSDAAIDDGDDIAYLSRRRDYEALRGAEMAMANASYVPPVPRASSVPPRSISAETRKVRVKSVKPLRSARPLAYHNARKIAAAHSVDNLSYAKEPKVKIVLESVPQGRDLLTSKEKMLCREVVDLESPSGTMALKMRIAGAQAMLDRQGAMLGRFSKGGGDKDLIEVDEEVRRLKTTQALRARSVM